MQTGRTDFLFRTPEMEFRGCLDLEPCPGVTSQRIDDSGGVLVVKTGSSQSVPDFLFLSFRIFVDLRLLLGQLRFCLVIGRFNIQKCPGHHRDRGGNGSCRSGKQDNRTAGSTTRDAEHQAKDGNGSILHPEDDIANRVVKDFPMACRSDLSGALFAERMIRAPPSCYSLVRVNVSTLLYRA